MGVIMCSAELAGG